MLDAVAEGNMETYEELCALGDSIEECFKNECVRNNKEIYKSSISNAEIQVYGDSAVVSYERSISLSDNEDIEKVKEIRTWNFQEGKGWKNIHLLRKEI